MQRIRQIPMTRTPLSNQLRGFLFDRDVVVESAKARIAEMRQEAERIEVVLLESIRKHGLDPVKAMKRLDRISPYGQLPEVVEMANLRSAQTSLTAIIDEYNSFVRLATDPRCKSVGTIGRAGLGPSDSIELNSDEAKFLLDPFDAKAFTESLSTDDYDMPGVTTALGGPMVPYPAHGAGYPAMSVQSVLGGEQD